jgi:hypothetical protein
MGSDGQFLDFLFVDDIQVVKRKENPYLPSRCGRSGRQDQGRIAMTDRLRKEGRLPSEQYWERCTY